MKTLLRALTVALIVAPGLGLAEEGDLSLYMGAITDHPFSDHEYVEDNRLIAVEYNSKFAGYFKNSYGEDAFAVGYRFKHQLLKHIEVSALVGMTYGYRDCFAGYRSYSKHEFMNYESRSNRKLCPAVSPMVSYTKYAIKPTLALLSSAVSLTARYDF